MAMSGASADMRTQLTTVFGQANYPVTDPFETIPSLPYWATTFEAGNVTPGAAALGTECAEYQEYPYDSVVSLVDDLTRGLHDGGVLQ